MKTTVTFFRLGRVNGPFGFQFDLWAEEDGSYRFAEITDRIRAFAQEKFPNHNVEVRTTCDVHGKPYAGWIATKRPGSAAVNNGGIFNIEIEENSN